MSVTAVPLQPIAKGSIIKLFAGVGLVILAALALAFWSTADLRKAHQTNEDWLADNAAEDGIKTTKSGLQYRIVKAGEGAKVTANDVVLVNYLGTLRDGTEFDKGEMTPFPAQDGALVPGMTEALRLASAGSTIEMWIKPELGYGEEPKIDQMGQERIPANSILFFRVDVLEKMPKEQFEKMVQQMQQQQMQPQGGMPGGMPPGM